MHYFCKPMHALRWIINRYISGRESYKSPDIKKRVASSSKDKEPATKASKSKAK